MDNNFGTAIDRRDIRLSILDDGAGGVDSGQRSGLAGLTDRAEALGGHLQPSSPTGSETSQRVDTPQIRVSARLNS
jgi:signal transduction histidine kinase